MNNEVKSIEDLATVIKNDIASVETKNAAVVEKLQKSVDELNAEVKKSKIGAAAGVETKSPLLETLEKSNLKSRTRGQGFDLEISTKAAVDMLAPTAVLSTAIPTLLPYQNVPTSVEDVIAKGTISGDTLKYVRETGFAGAPAFTKQGAVKAKVSITLATKTASTTKITAYFKVSEETTKDYPLFVTYLQARVATELNLVKQHGMLYGTGVDEDLQGIMPLASQFDVNVSKIANAQKIDVLRKAEAQVRKAKYKADAILMNPEDVADMELTKDSTGNYLLPTLYTGLLPQIGRVTIIECDAIAQGDFLVGAFGLGAQYFTREGLSIRVYDQNEDDAIKNMVTVVIEERGVQAVYRPEAFVKGSFDTAIAGITK